MRSFLKWAALACRVILGGVFIYASLDKIAHPAAFAEMIYNYQILPEELVNLAAITLPFIELVAGVLLIVGRLAWPSSAVLTGLLVVFIAALSYNLARGLDFECGCFTTSPQAHAAGVNTLIRDLFLLIPAAICLYFYRPRSRRSSPKTD
jgi:uncharacterized membrane protein YphA (DoxX/SURF4 family)